MTFALGQRWISDSESELGLGTVVAIDDRTLTLLFPASGDNRHYTLKEAPLTRVIYNAGDTVKCHEEWSLTVQDVQDNQGLITYVGPRTDNGEVVELRETLLDHNIRFNKPQDRLFTGQIDRSDWFALRYNSLVKNHEMAKSPLRGLLGGRISLIPHQLYIGKEVGQRFAPRVLLSDEVGLGKTIEAGLIIHQQLLTNRAQRVLLVVPENLQHQWLVEMLRRFNLRFSIFDEERCVEADLDARNPFDTEQLILISQEFLTKKRKWFEHATLADWDLIVVDEAHHLTIEDGKPSTAYQRIKALAEEAAGLLLITATPDQLGHESHFARLQLLDPDRFYDYDAFVEEEKHYQEVADIANLLLSNQILSGAHQDTLTNLLAESDISDALSVISNEAQDAALREEASGKLLSMLLDRHGTGRVLFRNTRGGVSGFPGRKLNAIGLPLPSQFATAIKVNAGLAGRQTLEQQATSLLFPEQIFEAFEGDSNTWWQHDGRVEWLVNFLEEHKQEKVLLICAHASTAITLENTLWNKHGIRTSVFHENMSIVERDKAAAYFASQEDSAQIMVCSEIGSEGRNFQFSHHLVLFDLPMNPDLLEQRIGRLDRIGQKHEVQIHVPYFQNTAQEVLLRWYQTGLNAFEHTCESGRLLYDQYSESLTQQVASNTVSEEFDEFLQQVSEKHQEFKAQLEQGRDRLLEINSSGGDKANQLAADVAEQDDDLGLAALMFSIFDVFGINQEDKGENALILKPSEHMLVPQFPGLLEEGMTITFDRDTALSREDMHFVSWDHPMVTGAMELLQTEEMGNNAVSLLKNKQLPVGTFFLELIFAVETSAPKQLQMGRYLPPTPIRVLLDKEGRNLASNVGFENFNRQLKPVNRHTASKLVNALQAMIHPLIEKAEGLASEQMQSVVSEAKSQMQQAMQDELARLKALKVINPSVRDEELDYLESQQMALGKHIDQALLKLDALRLVVVTHD